MKNGLAGRLPAVLAIGLAASVLPLATASASHTPAPASVNLAGSLESEATGDACGDWDPGCAASAFTSQGGDVWAFTSATIPAGTWEYKVALGSWDENYGDGSVSNGSNIVVDLAAPQPVRFYYSHATHYVADSVNDTIHTVPGSFNSEVGCAGDWQPDCLRTLMTDADGDGVFTYTTDAVPPGSYELKVATGESWSNPNYGEGGGGANVAFTVVASGQTVTVSFDSATSTPSVTVTSSEPSHDDNVEWDGVRHDSRDDLYRAPGGAVPAGTDVKLRLRTYHDDVTSVTARVYSLNANGQRLVPMHVAAADQSCEQAGLESKRCDWWEATLEGDAADNVWYRFVVTDGTDTDYYGDNTAALDGGLGAMTDEPVDQSWALMWHDPAFTAPAWAKGAVIYQIFPDRFRNGRANNDPKTGDARYDDPVLSLKWLTAPEGFCRNYADAGTSCPWRFDSTPPADSPTKEQPRGRDYQGGDLKGIDQQLEYLVTLGVNTLYLNPVFDAGSNHGYDTQDYTKIDPYFGTQKDWDNLVKHADRLGVRIILDGVFNHMSSDSPFFDRYGRYSTVGACESVDSPYRDWFTFRAPAGSEVATCKDAAGNTTLAYDGWFGFDSIPVLTKTSAEVQDYFLTSTDSVTRSWLEAGASGWRLDVSGDASFPDGYWQTFRSVAKGTDPDALLISETWQKDSTLLRMLRGDRLDTTMNYRFHDAVIGFLAPGSFDSKGFADSGRVISATELASRLASIREDYPDAAFYSLMNLLDSHDTERALWTLTPGPETKAGKEQDATNVAAGKQRLRLASLLQFALPGAPTVYYGDEVGVTGDDDPDDRRAYPWLDKGGRPDLGLFAWYAELAWVRRALPALREGDQRILLADDAAGSVAIGRRTGSGAAVVAVNRSGSSQTLTIPVSGYLPDGTVLKRLVATGAGVGNEATVTGGVLTVTVPAMGGVVLGAEGIDLTPPPAPTGLTSADGNGQATVSWTAAPGAAGYDVYVSFVSGGGYRKVNTSPVTTTSFDLTGLPNGEARYVVVRSLDAKGNASAPSAEDEVVPSLTIGWANLQWPPTMTHTVSTTNRTDTAYGQVWIDGATSAPGPTPTLWAQAGFGARGSDPAGGGWVWVDATFNTQAGNNDEFRASFLPEAVGDLDYVFRYSTNGGRSWLYADLNGPVAPGALPPNPGRLTVVSSGDTTAPAVPTGLTVTSASPAGIVLDWDDVIGDPSLHGYEVRRADTPDGPFTTVATVTASAFTDTAVAQGASYTYVVRSLDASFNRSADSAPVTATAQLRTVSLTFQVTVPATTDGTGRTVHIAGFLDRLDGGLPQWDPSGVELTRVDATTWSITLTGKEGTQIEYKYALGSWDYVEKDAGCGEVANRQLTLAYGATGTQLVSDSVGGWRNVSPCGN